MSRRGHRQVELQPIRQQEHPIDGRADLEIGQANAVALANQRVRPVLEDRADRHVIGDPECEVQVGKIGPPAVERQRADDSSGKNPIVGVCEL